MIWFRRAYRLVCVVRDRVDAIAIKPNQALLVTKLGQL